MITLAQQLSRIKTQRAAVIPYILRNVNQEVKLFFLLAQDRATGEWTDFGGGVKKFEYALETAFREFREESKEIFMHDVPNCNALSSHIAVMDAKTTTCTIFVPLPELWFERAILDFHDTHRHAKYRTKKCYNEIQHIAWFSESLFQSVIGQPSSAQTMPARPSSYIMWSKCKDFYQSCYHDELRVQLVQAYHAHYPCS